MPNTAIGTTTAYTTRPSTSQAGAPSLVHDQQFQHEWGQGDAGDAGDDAQRGSAPADEPVRGHSGRGQAEGSLTSQADADEAGGEAEQVGGEGQPDQNRPECRPDHRHAAAHAVAVDERADQGQCGGAGHSAHQIGGRHGRAGHVEVGDERVDERRHVGGLSRRGQRRGDARERDDAPAVERRLRDGVGPGQPAAACHWSPCTGGGMYPAAEAALLAAG
jgi:hypothetical protein